LGGRFRLAKELELGVFSRKKSGFSINAPHLDAGPQTPETQPRISTLVENKIRVNCIEVVLGTRSQNESAVKPIDSQGSWSQALVGDQCNPGCVLAKTENA
jgi:hypothetical protein